MRRSKPNALETFDFVHGLDELYERTLAIFHADFAFTVAIDDLAEQRNFPNAADHQLAAFSYDIFDAPTSFPPSCVRHNTKGAKLVAALHDTHKCGDRLCIADSQGEMFANGGLATGFFVSVHHFVAAPGKEIIEVFAGAMKLLRPQHEIHIRQLINQLPPAALCHAAHEAKHGVRIVLSGLADERLHFVECFLLSSIAHAAGIQQNDICRRLFRRDGIALRHKLCGDGLAVALVHLAPVSFNENTRHSETADGTPVAQEWKEQTQMPAIFRKDPL